MSDFNRVDWQKQQEWLEDRIEAGRATCMEKSSGRDEKLFKVDKHVEQASATDPAVLFLFLLF